MLLSEILGWVYVISWDNPVPANSNKMLKALKKLGRVTTLHTKTSVVFSPKATTTWHYLRVAIENNLNAKNGSAFYVNLQSRKAFQFGKKTNHKWKAV